MNITVQITPIYEAADGKIVKIVMPTATEYHAYSPQGEWRGRSPLYFGAVAILNNQN